MADGRHALPRRDRRSAAGPPDRSSSACSRSRRSGGSASTRPRHVRRPLHHAPPTRTSTTRSSGDRFRQDLYYRLKIISIELPPLRERPEDVAAARRSFPGRVLPVHGAAPAFVSPVALEMLLHYPWPGNVRELQNEVQRSLVMAGGGPLILEEHLSPKINPAGLTYSSATHRFAEAKADFERRFLLGGAGPLPLPPDADGGRGRA
ncbi:MAG: hypothetical protein MZV64_33705 [Ignavibacteriales bacterium]|nr:hypothetical protein [Ignavibacteriales bacterium]